jgi:hypothetical protein
MKTTSPVFSKFKLLIALALGVVGAGLLYAQINIPTDLTVRKIFQRTENIRLYISSLN